MSLTAVLLLAYGIQLPTFAVLGWLFARGRARRHWLPALAGALLLALAATAWGHGLADAGHGALWPLVLATVTGYGVFLLALGLAWWLPSLAAPRSPDRFTPATWPPAQAETPPLPHPSAPPRLRPAPQETSR
jgi:hypothetical protein